MANDRNILQYDTQMDRREILVGLLGNKRMTDAKRLDFIAWCCKRALGSGIEFRPVPVRGRYTAREALADLVALSLQGGLPVDTALAELTRRVRGL
jgi:hypothetical protein